MEETYPKTWIKMAMFLHFIYTWLSFNIYLPSLPTLAKAFGITSNETEYSITVFTLAFALSQIVWGPLSEIFGKKKILLISCSISIVGLVIVIFSQNFLFFNIGRFIEALGVASIGVIGRALLHEILDQQSFGKTVSKISAMAFLMPAVAPIIGGYLLKFFEWRAIFVFLLIYNIVLLILEIFYVKSPPSVIAKEDRLNFLLIVQGYLSNLKSKEFLGVLTPYMIGLGCMLSFYAVAPFIFIDHLGYSSSSYTFFTLIPVGCYMLGTFTVSQLLKKCSPKKALNIGVLLMLISTVGFGASLFFQTFTLINLLVPICLFVFCCGIISPATNSAAMNIGVKMRCYTAATISFSAYFATFILTSILPHLPMKNNLFFNLFYIVFGVFAFSIFMNLAKRNKEKKKH